MRWPQRLAPYPRALSRTSIITLYGCLSSKLSRWCFVQPYVQPCWTPGKGGGTGELREPRGHVPKIAGCRACRFLVLGSCCYPVESITLCPAWQASGAAPSVSSPVLWPASSTTASRPDKFSGGRPVQGSTRDSGHPARPAYLPALSGWAAPISAYPRPDESIRLPVSDRAPLRCGRLLSERTRRLLADTEDYRCCRPFASSDLICASRTLARRLTLVTASPVRCLPVVPASPIDSYPHGDILSLCALPRAGPSASPPRVPRPP